MREICVAEKHISENVPVIYLELEAPEYSSSRVLAEGRVVTKTVKCSGWSADIHFSKKKKGNLSQFSTWIFPRDSGKKYAWMSPSERGKNKEAIHEVKED